MRRRHSPADCCKQPAEPLRPALGDADAFKVCSPSRSAFHTGRYPFTLGLYDNSPRAVPHLRPQITNGLDPDVSVRRAVPSGYKLLPELLAAKGYRRHAVGKWHLGMALRKCAWRPSCSHPCVLPRGRSAGLFAYSRAALPWLLDAASASLPCPLSLTSC